MRPASVPDISSAKVSWQSQYFLTARNGQAARHSAETPPPVQFAANDWEAALRVIDDMLKRELLPRSKLAEVVSRSYLRADQPKTALSIAEAAAVDKENLIPRERGRNWKEAIGLLQAMEDSRMLHESRTCAAAVSACLAAGVWATVLRTFMMVEKAGVRCNQKMLFQTILACKEVAQLESSWRIALWCIREIPRKMRRESPDKIPYVAALQCLGRARKWEFALKVLSEAWLEGVAPRNVLYGLAVEACAGEADKICELIAEMRNLRLTPDRKAYGIGTRACELCSEWEEALGLVSKMQEDRVDADPRVYAPVLRACSRAGRLGNAVEMMSRMQACRKVVDALAYNQLLAGFAKAREGRRGLKLAKLMKEDRSFGPPNLVTCVVTAELCAIDKDWAYAVHMLDEMTRMPKVHRSKLDSMYSSVAQACQSAGYFSKAAVVEAQRKALWTHSNLDDHLKEAKASGGDKEMSS